MRVPWFGGACIRGPCGSISAVLANMKLDELRRLIQSEDGVDLLSKNGETRHQSPMDGGLEEIPAGILAQLMLEEPASAQLRRWPIRLRGVQVSGELNLARTVM